jgi:hypothetical protein
MITVEKDGSRRATVQSLVRAALPPAIGRMWCPRRAVPAVEATAAIGWVQPRTTRQHRLCGSGGGHAATVEMKASERCDGEEGIREPWRNAVTERNHGLTC